jgi:hypothetical protein
VSALAKWAKDYVAGNSEMVLESLK